MIMPRLRSLQRTRSGSRILHHRKLSSDNASRNGGISCSWEASDSSLLSPRRWAFGASCAIFSFGFAALNIFTILRSGQPHLPGLYIFRSATVGDGLLLPLLAYSLIRSAGLQRGWSRYQHIFAISAGALAALAGIMVQVHELTDPDTRLNWTFSAPHSYNLPGWYHAGFLIVASGFFGWAMALVLLRIRQEAACSAAGVRRRIRSVRSLRALIPAMAFVGLLSEDDLSGNQVAGLLLLAIMLGLGMLLSAVLCWASGPANVRWCVLAVAGSLVPAITLCGLFLPGLAASLSSALPAAIAGLVGIFSSRFLNAVSRPDRLGLAVCLAVCAAGPVYAVSGAKVVTVPRLAIGCFIGLLLITSELAILRFLLPSHLRDA